MWNQGRLRCGACVFFRTGCSEDCIFAPYFPSTDPERFESVNSIYGANNVGMILQQIPVHLRGDAVETMLFEARSRIQDSVHGCVAIVAHLHQEILAAQRELAAAEAQIAYCRAVAAAQQAHQYELIIQADHEEDEASISSAPEEDPLDRLDDEEPLPDLINRSPDHFDEMSMTSFEGDNSDG